jgi:hypothetical protein
VRRIGEFDTQPLESHQRSSKVGGVHTIYQGANSAERLREVRAPSLLVFAGIPGLQLTQARCH